MTARTRIFVFKENKATSAAGKPYSFQQVQIIQLPDFPDTHDRIFVNAGAEPLEPGLYEADMYVRSTKDGNRPAFANFTKVSE